MMVDRGMYIAVNYIGRLVPSKRIFDQAHADIPQQIVLGQSEPDDMPPGVRS